MEVKQKSLKETPSLTSSPRKTRNQNLYQALLEIYKFSQLKDLFLLKKKEFSNLCNVQKIHWYLDENIFKNESLIEHNFKDHLIPAGHSHSCSLAYNNQIYGELIFISSKITKTQCLLLKEIGFALSAFLHFMQNKKRLETSRRQWELTFDSFHKAFCIIDDNFHILKFNQAFSKHVGTSKMMGLKIDDVFPFPIELPEKEGTWIVRGKKGEEETSLEFHLETLYLKNKRFPIHLIRVEDVTKRIKMKQKIAQQAQQQELGFIKGSVAHELNNPLAGIKTLLHLVLSDVPAHNTFAQTTLKEMDEALGRCQNMIQNLLSVSHISQKKTEPSPRS